MSPPGPGLTPGNLHSSLKEAGLLSQPGPEGPWGQGQG